MSKSHHVTVNPDKLPPGVDVEPVDAAGCTALGCTASEKLVRVSPTDADVRILCPECAAEYLNREVQR